MFKKGFTFVVIPPQTSRVIKIRIPKGVLIGLGVGLCAFTAASLIAIFSSVSLNTEMRAYERLKNEYLHQQVAIKKVSNKVNGFKDQIERLRELDYKLRLITDLEVERPRPSIYGIGGFMESTDKLLAKEAEKSNMDLLTLLNKDLSRLEKQARYQEESFNNLKMHLSDKKDLIERTPFRWPIRGFTSSTFGPRTDPFTGQSKLHSGMDIVSPRGTPIKAPANGIVTFSGANSGFGNMIVVDHGYGLITRYAHNDTNLVQEGQRIKRGDTVGTVGCTGRCTGPHLHYEILINDVPINPRKLIID